MAKIWDETINKNTDWGGDETTNNLPVSGKRVQEFIKNTFDSKAGVFYYDTANNRYLVFADTEARDKYLENPTLVSLILGTFDAPFNYSAEITLSTPSYVAILLGTTNNYIDFTFDVKNKQGQSTGEDVICTFTFIRGSIKKEVTQRYRPNTSVHFNIDNYLLEGTNTIIIGITGQNTLAATTVSVTYQVVNLFLEDSMDISKVYNLLDNPNSTVEIPYTVSGYGTKIMEWYLDGELLDFIRVEDEIVDTISSRTKYISLASLNQGAHSIQFRAYTMIDGERFYSQTLYRDVIVYTGANRNHIIALSATIPIGNPILKPEDGMKLYGITQYMPYNIVFAVYSPTNEESINTSLTLDEDLLTTIKATNGTVYTYSLISSTYGVRTLVLSTSSATYNVELNISKTTTTLQEITGNLQLDLRAVGKSNDSIDRDSWSFGDYEASFYGFNWNETSGWSNGKLVIPNGAYVEVDIAPFSPDPTISGKTLEFEFSTANVSDDNSIICDLRNSRGVGLLLTASEATLVSSGGAKVTTKYKSEESIRISFVINRKTGVTMKGLVFIYINGVACGSTNFSSNDTFTSDRLLKISGTSGAEVNLKSLRFYDTALTSDQLLNNYILYRDTVEEMMSIYDKNNIYDENGVSFSTDILAGQLPIMIVTGDIPSLENTNDKNKTIVVDVEYTNLQDPSRSFTLKSAQMRPQGTSSMSYPKKNFRLYTTKRDDTKLYDADGKLVPDRLYSFKEGAQPVDCWCMKADYAESSGTHNTGIARLWNEVMTNAQIDGEYLLRTEAQKKAIENDYPYDVRTTVDGFPILMFYRLTSDSELIFIGKYNFNNDKSTESVFGFVDIPGFDNTNMQCWEVLNNGNHLALFQDVINFDDEWEEAFEARYPDVGSDADITKLKAFCEWIVSTKDDVEKFKTEKWNHIDVYKMAAYYVYLMRFGAVDQTVKNAMFTSEDGVHFYYINYDNDTILGVRNDGLLVYPPTIDRQTLDDTFETTVYAYAGHDSTLWNNLEADSEFMEIVAKVDNALYGAGLTYQNVINMFDKNQSEKWCERIYNQDAQYKYIGPFTDSSINNLYMLQGPRKSHRRWWLSRRFNLLDSKFISGDYKANSLELKMASAPIGISFKIVAGFNMDYGYGVNNVPIDTGVSLLVGQEHSFITKQVLNIGDPLRIYSAVNLQEVDVHEFIEYLSTIIVTSVYSETLGTKLKKFIIGVDTDSDSRRNTSISDISGLSQAKRLEYLDISGYKGILYLDLAQLFYLKTFKAKQSGLTSVLFAQGSPLTTLELPSTLQVIELNDLPNIEESGILIEENWKKIRGIKISKCPNLNTASSLIFNWFKTKESSNSECSLVLDGIYWLNVDVNDVIALGDIKNAGGTLSLKGRIRLTSCTQEQIQILRDIYGENCFDPNSELYISAPDAVYITGPSEINETESATYVGVAFSDYPGEIRYRLTGSTSGASIDEATGVLTTTETGSTRTVTVVATHYPTQGAASYAEMQVRINKLVYPTGGTIEGPAIVDGTEEYALTLEPEGITGPYTVEWSLEGEAVDEGYIYLRSQNGTRCAVGSNSVSAEIKNATLKAVINPNKGSDITVTKALQVIKEGVIMTSLSNPEAMTICYDQGWCMSPDYMLEEEAAAVTDIGTVFYDKVTHFDEFQYFTGVTQLKSGALGGTSKQLTSIIFPDSLTTLTSGSFYDIHEDTLDLKNVSEIILVGTRSAIEDSKIGTLIIRKPITVSKSGAYLLSGTEVQKIEIYTNEASHITDDVVYDSGRKVRVKEIAFMTPDTTIGEDFCSSLYNVSIDGNEDSLKLTNFENVKAIKAGAFGGVVPVEIPLYPSLETIEEKAFFPFTAGITFVNKGNTKYTAIHNNLVLIENGRKALVAMPYSEYTDTPEELVLPETVTEIAAYFCSNSNTWYYDRTKPVCFSAIKGENVTTVGQHFVSYIGKLKRIEFPNIEELPRYFIANCSDLTNLVISPKVTVLPNNCIQYVKNLTLDFINQITSFGNECVSGIVEEFNIGSHVTHIGEMNADLYISRITSSNENYKTDANGVILYQIDGSGYATQIWYAKNNEGTLVLPDEIIRMRQLSDSTSVYLEGCKLSELDLNNLESSRVRLVSCLNLKKIIVRKALTASNDTGNFGINESNYTGRNTYDTGENELIVPENATGYDAGVWLDPLCNPEKCGFTLKKTLPAIETLETLSMENKQLRSFATMAINTMNLTDEESIEYLGIYPKWRDLWGKKISAGFKLQYNGSLYKVKVEHYCSEEWIPSETPSLYQPISTAKGTIDDPIKWTTGMELVEGKYYLDEGIKYLCIRNSGQGMSYSLKDLVSGGFVQQV